MALQITQKNGIIHVEGEIKTETIESFVTYLNYAFDRNTKIVVNIDKVTAIDVSGLKMLRIFDRLATIKAKRFYIIGYGSKEIYEDFEMTKHQVA